MTPPRTRFRLPENTDRGGMPRRTVVWVGVFALEVDANTSNITSSDVFGRDLRIEDKFGDLRFDLHLSKDRAVLLGNAIEPNQTLPTVPFVWSLNTVVSTLKLYLIERYKTIDEDCDVARQDVTRLKYYLGASAGTPVLEPRIVTGPNPQGQEIVSGMTWRSHSLQEHP